MYFKTFCPRSAFKSHMLGIRRQQHVHEKNKPKVSQLWAHSQRQRGVCIAHKWSHLLQKRLPPPLSHSDFCRNTHHLDFHALGTGISRETKLYTQIYVCVHTYTDTYFSSRFALHQAGY